MCINVENVLSFVKNFFTCYYFFAEVNCGSPPIVDNSERHVLGHSYNDTVTYTCDVGYELVGDDLVICLVAGHWSMPPVCKGIKFI